MSSTESERTKTFELLKVFNCSESDKKMGEELATLMEVYHLVKKAGRSATLTLSTRSGKATTVKFEIELDDASPLPASTATSSSPSTPAAPVTGSQRRHRRSRAKRAKANARAAQYQATQAASTPSSPASGESLPSPPPPPPPPPPSTRRIVTVGKKASTWPPLSQLDGEVNAEEVECETCEDHCVTESCYFVCIGDRDCYQAISPFCNGCKWKKKQQTAQQQANNDQTSPIEPPCDMSKFDHLP